MISIRRVEVDDFNKVTAIEFFEGASRDEILHFLREFKIGRNFQPLVEQEQVMKEAAKVDKEAFMRL